MKLFPAIDIKDGKCVRLTQGNFQNVMEYSDSPLKVAKNWEAQGASFIHIVDLDGALVGHSVNDEVIRSIVTDVKIPVQVGGGIRTIQDIEKKLDLGVERVIIGTKAVKDPAFIKEAVMNFGTDRIVIGIDAKDGMVAIEGWEKISSYHAVSFALDMKHIGIKTIVYTDISKDGMLQGPNLTHTRELVQETGLNIIASGGISSLKDLEMLSEIEIYGAIIGKALYENRIELSKAIQMFER